MADLIGHLPPRGIIPAYPSCPTLCCHGRPDRPSPASWHTLGISSGSATIPTADSNKRLFYNSILLDHFASFVDSPAFLAAGQGDATVPAAGLFAGHSCPLEGVFRVLEIVCRHCRLRFSHKVRNRLVSSWHREHSLTLYHILRQPKINFVGVTLKMNYNEQINQRG